MATAIGRRNCLCTLMQNQLGERDGHGHQGRTPVPVGRFWCEVVQLSSQEIQSFQQLYPLATYRFRTIYTQSIKPQPNMWFEYNGREFHIVGAPNNINERNVEWEFLTSEPVPVRTSDLQGNN